MWRSAVLVTAVLSLTGTVNAQAPRYVGAGGCASSNCHGATSPIPEKDSRILGNEYAIWAVNDKHSKAWNVLSEPRSKRMAEILGIADAQTDVKCTVCHATGSPEKSRSDGVACEACHGPAEKWLGVHVQANSHPQSVSLGLIDTKDLRTRARNCLECHLGTKDRVVDHQLIAAGHPDLNFELDTFTWAQPSHHREPKPAEGNSLPRVRAWATGQAVALAQGMRLLASRAERSWPELSEFECYQCHHDLRLESWRIQRGYAGRRPGDLQPNLSRTEVLRVLAAQAAPDKRGAVEGAIDNVASIVAARLTDGPAVAAAANGVASQADELVARFAAMDFKPDQARAIVRALSGGITRIANAGPHSAEVATMTLDALTAALEGQTAQQRMAPLYDYLEHPSAYQPDEFARLFRQAAGSD